jgi:hypothetical protein
VFAQGASGSAAEVPSAGGMKLRDGGVLGAGSAVGGGDGGGGSGGASGGTDLGPSTGASSGEAGDAARGFVAVRLHTIGAT